MNKKKVKALAKVGAYLATLSLLIVSTCKSYGDKVNELKNMHTAAKTYDEIDENNMIYLGDTLDVYNDYIESVAKCIKLFHLDENVFDVYNAYTLMQDSGYLSIGDTFSYKIPDNEILNHYGLSIIFGSGVCRNQADNLRNVLVKLGYNAGLASGELYTGFSKNQTNHAVVYVITDEENIYLLDPTNHAIYLRNINGRFVNMFNKDVKFILSPDYDKIIGEYDNNQELYEFKESNYDRKIIINDKYQASYDKILRISNVLSIYEERFISQYEAQFVDEYNDYLNKMNEIEHQDRNL